MKKFARGSIVTSIDIGTTKICVLVAHAIDSTTLDIIGIGKAPSIGISKGIIVDIAQAVKSIKDAVKEAELMAGISIETAYIGVSGAHIQAYPSNGMVPVKGGRVKQADITAVLAAARSVSVPEGQQILHVLPQYYVIDGHCRVTDPLGLYCMRLETQVHIVTGAVASVQNLARCCQLIGITVQDVVLEPLASAYSVLSEDERALGVAMLDIGGGTSDFALYQQGAIRHTKIFPIAGNHVTQDIALCLRTTIKSAENIKREYGCSLVTNNLDLETEFEVEMVQGNQHRLVSIKDLVSIIEPRIDELLYMIQQEISHYNLKPYMPAGIVLTGGGALLNKIDEHALGMLSVPVRVGVPCVPSVFENSLKNPTYATGYGLLLYALNNNYNCFNDNITGPLVARVFSRMKSWVADFF